MIHSVTNDMDKPQNVGFADMKRNQIMVITYAPDRSYIGSHVMRTAADRWVNLSDGDFWGIGATQIRGYILPIGSEVTIKVGA
jgi:hypothetical protein